MNESPMLHAMCHEVLSSADIKAICKARGFSAQEAASRSLFENFYLSEIGVREAMNTCSDEEISTLHLLKWAGKEVDISFFDRVYGDTTSRSKYSFTFTQRYQNVFKKVQAGLLRKGLLLMAEDPRTWIAGAKMERWRIRLPSKFEAFLPPPIRPVETLKGSGDTRTDVLRDKVMQIVHPMDGKGDQDMAVSDGSLWLGKEPFRVRRLEAWQQSRWRAEADLYTGPVQGLQDKQISATEAAAYVFAQLGENEWLQPDQLSGALRIFCDRDIDGRKICAAGWKWGYLARQEIGDKTYFRLPPAPGPAAATLVPSAYLDAADGQLTLIDLAQVPYAELEILARIANLQVMGDRLAATPDLIKLGDAYETVRDTPIVHWLGQNVAAFGQAIQTATQRWGRKIVHTHILAARVDDLGLYVQLQKALADSSNVVFMPNNYIAFSSDMLGQVTQIVTKAGHVIRTVQNDEATA